MMFFSHTVSTEGMITYSEVITFLKNQPTTLVIYKSIMTSMKTIRLSGNHLIFARKNAALKFHPMYVTTNGIKS